MGEHNCYNLDQTECIEKKAYELWLKDGCKQGRDQLPVLYLFVSWHPQPPGMTA